MKNSSHLFFVIFFAIIIAIGLVLKIMGGENSYENTIPEYSVWVLFLLSFAIWLSEKYKKLYLFFAFASLFLLATCALQVLTLMEAQEIWDKVFRALVLAFSVYIYITMFIAEQWALLKQHNN